MITNLLCATDLQDSWLSADLIISVAIHTLPCVVSEYKCTK